MKKITFFCLLMLFCLVAKAQDDVVLVGCGFKDMRILYKRDCCPSRCPKINTDRKTKKTVGIWDDMEMGYVKDICTVDAPVAADFDKIFNGGAKTSSVKGFTLLYWLLTEENDETVLHCYFTMPADEMKNLWLACRETAIVDRETGVQYRARRTAPECFNKHFSVKASVGTALDFKIYFPKLAPAVKEISIYGVPLWGLRGTERFHIFPSGQKYDDKPQIRNPRLVKDENNYVIDKYDTWAVYTDAHLISPVEEGTTALWRTPEATYLAVAHEQNWMREYYGVHDKTFLFDNRGNRYGIKSISGLPLGKTFWIDGNSGDFIVFLLEFEPIPPDVTTVSYIESENPEYDLWRADWNSKIRKNLNVEDLRKNQSLFKYHPRQVKE